MVLTSMFIQLNVGNTVPNMQPDIGIVYKQ